MWVILSVQAVPEVGCIAPHCTIGRGFGGLPIFLDNDEDDDDDDDDDDDVDIGTEAAALPLPLSLSFTDGIVAVTAAISFAYDVIKALTFSRELVEEKDEKDGDEVGCTGVPTTPGPQSN